MYTPQFVEHCLATKSFNSNNTKWNGRGDNGCCGNINHSLDRTAFILRVHAAPSGKWLYRGSNIPQGVQYSSTLGSWTENRIITDGWHVRTFLQWWVERSKRNHLVSAGMRGELHSLVLVASFLVSLSVKHANSNHFSKWETYSFMFHRVISFLETAIKILAT